MKFRHIRDVCKVCWPEVREELKAHAGGCGCTFELVAHGTTRPDWMTMDEHPAEVGGHVQAATCGVSGS